MAVKKFSVKSLNARALSGYCSNIQSHMDQDLPADEKALFARFTNAFLKVEELSLQGKEPFGEKIRQADCVADRAYCAIRDQLKINGDHYDGAVCQASQLVTVVFNESPNPTKMSYNEEYIELKRLVSRMESIDSNVLKLAMVDGWLGELKRRVNEFEALRLAQNDANSETVAGMSKKAREELIDAYRALIDTLNVMLEIRPTLSLEIFARHVEELNEAERAKQKSQATKEEKDKAKEAEKAVAE